MNKNSLLFLLSILVGIHSKLYAQTVSIVSVIATAANDERVARDSAMEAFTNKLKYHLPPVKKLEFRVGFNGNNTPDSLDGNIRNEDYYSVSLATNNWKEMKMQKKVKPAQIAIFSKEKEVFRMAAIKDRYLVVSNLYYSQTALQKKKELLELLAKKNELLQQLLKEGVGFKISDALDNEKDQVIYSTAIQDEENNLSLYQTRLKQFFYTNSEIAINYSDMITVNKIQRIYKSIFDDSTSLNPLVKYKEAQYQLAKSDYNLERAQNMNIVNSFQVGYNRPAYTPEVLKKFNPDNTLTFRLGITVPFSGNFNYNRNNANIQQYDALLNWQNTRALQIKTVDVQKSKLENSLKQYKVLSDIYENSVIGKLLANEKVMAQSTALEIMDMKIARKKIEINMVMSAGNLMQSYIELLDSKGLLQLGNLHTYMLEQ